MTEAELKKHLDAAEKSPKEIAAAVSGLSNKALQYKPSPEKWCVLEILGHLADVEIIYGYRLRGGYQAGDRADRSGRLGPQSELLGFASFGTGGVLWVGTSSQLAAAAKSEGF